MQKTLDIASEFLIINNIKANSNKSTLFYINASKEDQNKEVMFTNTTVMPKEKHKAVRILEV